MNVNIFDISIPFQEKALEIFHFQKDNNPVYGRFCKALGILNPDSVNKIPLLPIQAFKETQILTAENPKEINLKNTVYFQSSGTSGMQRSTHYLLDTEIYKQSIISGMKHFYELDEYVIWAYTPGYSSNPNSSLIWMLNTLIERDTSGLSRFLELNKPLSQNELDKVTSSGKKLMIFGAAFGLLDVLEMEKVNIPKNSIVMETGGMKTHRREMTKSELHQTLSEGFDLPQNQIHSEYGMSELLSQAYSLGGEWFECVPWMNVTIRNPENPMEIVPNGTEGLIGVIDLANRNSCAFILTEDKGVMGENGRFKVLGRWSPQNLRGCNFLIDQD